jgi:dolichol-phosphate mannosyltransferase
VSASTAVQDSIPTTFVPTISIVVPIVDEDKNVPTFLQLQHKVAEESGEAFEVLFVDDSKHQQCVAASSEAIAKLHQHCGGTCKHIRVVHNLRENGQGGLSGAVLDGIRLATSDIVVVMDGDLQHPPALIPQLIEELDDHDLVATTRYAEGGSSEGLSGPIRWLVSKASTYLAKTLFPRRLRAVSDPMTGFFALNRQKVDIEQMNPDGFKILLSFLLHHNLRATEVPFAFGERNDGESKGTVKQGLKFIDQLLSHRLENPIVSFIVGGVAIGGLGSLLLSGMTRLGLPEVWAYVIQFILTVYASFAFNKRYTWRNQSEPKLKQQLTLFGFTRALTFFGSVPVFSVLIAHGVHHQAAYVGLLLAGGVFNYFTSRFIFTRIVNV